MTLCKKLPQLPQTQRAQGSSLHCNIISVTFVPCCPHPPGYGAVAVHTIPALNRFSRLQDFNGFAKKKNPLDSWGLEFHTCSWKKSMFNGVHLIYLEHLKVRNSVNDITQNLSDLITESSELQKSNLLCPKIDGQNRWG